MNKPSSISRRTFLRLAGGAAAALAGGAAVHLLGGCVPRSGQSSPPQVSAVSSQPPTSDGLEIALKAVLVEVPIFPGKATRVWSYRGEVLRGDAGAVQHLPNSHLGPVMRVVVDRKETATSALPQRLSDLGFDRPENAANQNTPRTFEIAMRRMQWFLNGRTFEMEKVARNEVVRMGDSEIWEFVNQSGPMRMIHPMHVHNVQFQVIERQVSPQLAGIYDTVREGYVDEGWKDTVLLMPGERVKILGRFEDYEGLYLYHCHNLEHEDLGLMRNYRVRA